MQATSISQQQQPNQPAEAISAKKTSKAKISAGQIGAVVGLYFLSAAGVLLLNMQWML